MWHKNSSLCDNDVYKLNNILIILNNIFALKILTE